MIRAAAWSLEVCTPTVLEALAGRVRRDVCDARIDRWSKKLLDDVGVRVEVVGREHLDPAAPMLVMSNHQSLYDVPALYQTLPHSVRMVTKTELFRIPIFGRALRAAEFVEVDRGHRARAIESLRNARRLFESGITVWIAPEGTRSPDGRLGPFKKGGFILAEEAGVPILPVSVDGTHRILPARTTDLHYGQPVRVTIHPRVRRDEVASREAWMDRVRDAIASGLTNP
jgi:1-acyl-sn-glycerol-3-phosphate acyltransferase